MTGESAIDRVDLRLLGGRRPATGARLPDWLVEQLASAGRLNIDGVGLVATAQVCRRCRAVVIAGLDGDVAGMPFRAEPAAVTVAGEVWAVLAGRHTFRLNGRIPKLARLDGRYSWDRELSPAGSIDEYNYPVLVLVEHKCGIPVPAEFFAE